MSKQKKGLVPELRFPEFEKEPNWPCVQLNAVAKRSTSKNKGEKVSRVLTNSAVDGVVDQRDYFEKDIAVKGNLESYYIVDKGDYVYNPRISSTAPVGPISKNKVGKGVMSPLYTVFKFNSKKNDFFEQFFKSSRWHGYLQTISNSGARHDRMSITSSEFMAMPVPNPGDMEQQKIADFLASIDELITLHTQKLDALKDHKKGLMQQLFPAEGEDVPKLRFSLFRDKGPWNEKSLGELCLSISSGRDKADSDGSFDLYGSTGVIGKTSQDSYKGRYILVARVGANAGFLNKAEGVFGVTDNTIVLNLNHSESIDFIYFMLLGIDLNRLIFGSGQPLITGSQLKALNLRLPSESEQRKISDFLTSIDDTISAQLRKIESLKAHKLGLTQKLFPIMDEVL